MCSGTTTKRVAWPVARKSAAQRGPGFFRVISTVSGSEATALSTHSSIADENSIPGASALSIPKVKATSSAVSGSPSDHFTPSRSSTVRPVKSSL